MAVQDSRNNEAWTGDDLHYRDSCFSANRTAEGADGESGYYKFCFLRIVFLSPASQFHQYTFAGGNNPSVVEADKPIRGRLAVIFCYVAWDFTFLQAIPLVPI